MTSSMRDRITGAILLAVAVVWIGLVYARIDPGQAAVGPRTFPLVFGYALAVLSLVLLAQSFLAAPVEDKKAPAADAPSELFSVVSVIVAIALYGMLLEPLGFIIATALIVALMMVIILRIYAPHKVLAMSIGLSLGCFLVFGKLLGTFLPAGKYYPIYF